MMRFCNIKNRKELADFLSIKRGQLTYILYFSDMDNYYETFDIPKKEWRSTSDKRTYWNFKIYPKKISVCIARLSKGN